MLIKSTRLVNEKFKENMTLKSLITDTEIADMKFVLYEKVIRLRERVNVIVLHLLINYRFNTIRKSCLNVF